MNLKLIKKRFKKKFKKPIKSSEIKKIWDDFIQDKRSEVTKGGQVKIDKYSSLEIIGTPIWNDVAFVERLKKGQMMRKDGSLTAVNLHPRRKDIKYKIVYTNSLHEALYIDADRKFKKEVHEAIINTNTYYKINDQ